MIRFAELRALALLRRIARAAESIADSQATLARCAADEHSRKHRPRARTKLEISSLDLDAVNESWHAQQIAAGLEEDDGQLHPVEGSEA